MQSEKFDALVETCSAKTPLRKIYRTRIKFISFFKISDKKYILHLQCYSGAYQPGGVYFLFTKTDGIQTKPLVLTRLIEYKTRKPKETPIADKDDQSIAGYQKFDDEKKELHLTRRCDGQWSCFAVSRYSLVNDQLMLQEYIVGFRNTASKDIHYTTHQLIRDRYGWVSSGAMKCRGVGLETCIEVINP